MYSHRPRSGAGPVVKPQTTKSLLNAHFKDVNSNGRKPTALLQGGAVGKNLTQASFAEKKKIKLLLKESIHMTKRTLYALLAGVIAVSLIVGGVFAWIDNAQHKSNVVTGGPDNIAQDVVLIEDFEEPEDWLEGDELTKKISVKNTGEGEIFVRVQLKEYMEVSAQHYDYAKDAQDNILYLLVDSDGKFVASANTGNDAADKASFKLALDNMGLEYDDSQIVGRFTAYGGDGVARFYLKTDGTTNLNGKNGKQLLVNFDQDAPEPFVTGAIKGSYENTTNNQLHKTAECNYAVHVWDGADHCDCNKGDVDKFHKYVQWNLGDDLILMSEWDGLPVDKWILDDVSAAKDEGWAYWGKALQPDVETSKLMESIELIKQPDGPFYYALHVDMQAADIYQLKSNFVGMPTEIENVYRPIKGLSITADKTTVGLSGTATFSAYFDGAPITASWSFARKDGASNSAHPNTKIDPATGVLSIGPAQVVPVVLVIMAKYTPAGGTEQTKTFEITVQ